MELLSSPSYHFISPLARSRSDVRSAAMRRSSSYSGSGSLSYSPSMTRFSRPSYGYGGGYMARSLSRSGTGLFNVRELHTAFTALSVFLGAIGLLFIIWVA
ncbi:hypothetical protein OESDEN_16424 [Oesophagostomum dentatum]|uniref:Uncharacterized protein n=1 Tax=Oesophagostomum dentatum TaxID=61180 RepID=A0A0B1SJ02_OESDE|nr:hypothetical protein OESDEN_16424 [Oesophagostomum dentatum]